MKTAQELNVGNTFKVGSEVFIILKSTFNKSGRNSAVVNMKLKNLITGGISETVYKAADKMEDIRLDEATMKYMYSAGDMYSFQDQETWEQVDLPADDLGDALNYLQEEMEIKVISFEGKAVGVELPIFITREITWTEPAVRGDTSGKVMKPAKIDTGYEIMVPAFLNEGDMVKIDTRTGDYLERVNK